MIVTDDRVTSSPFHAARRCRPSNVPVRGEGANLAVQDGSDLTIAISAHPHDIGAGVEGNGQIYPHNMEVEENANYLLAALAYWRRTDDDSPLHQNRDVIIKLLDFLVAADTNKNGVPDEGVSNTIDDACPAVQFAHEQVKSL